MNLELVITSEENYKKFQEKHDYRNFMNSLEMIKLKRKRGSEVEIIGVKDDDNFIAMAAVSYQKIMKRYQYATIQRGFLIDYHDTKVFDFFVCELKKHLAKKRCIYLHMDPHVLHRQRDIHGDEVASGFNNDDIIETLKCANFQHLGFTVGNSQKYQPRWTFVLPLENISKEKLLDNMNKRTRYNIQKSIHDEISIKELSVDDLSVYIDIMEHTSERRHFDIRDKTYYEDYLSAYGEKAQLMLAYLNVEKHIQKLNEYQKESMQIIRKYRQCLDTTSEKKRQKYLNIIDSENDKINNYQNSIYEVSLLKEVYGNDVPLSASIFVIQDDEIVYLFGGSYKKLLKYKANYALQWHMIQQALENNCSKYNFFGISGDFREDADDYGVFKFKQGFDGHVEEYIGDFILPIKKLHYRLYKVLKGTR